MRFAASESANSPRETLYNQSQFTLEIVIARYDNKVERTSTKKRDLPRLFRRWVSLSVPPVRPIDVSAERVFTTLARVKEGARQLRREKERNRETERERERGSKVGEGERRDVNTRGCENCQVGYP